MKACECVKRADENEVEQEAGSGGGSKQTAGRIH